MPTIETREVEGRTILIFGKPGECGAACDHIDKYPGGILAHWGAYENAIILPENSNAHD